MRPVIGWVAIGGAAGAAARYLVTEWSVRQFGQGFPVGTLVVNASGSLALGFIAGIALGAGMSEPVRGVVAIGFLGAYTTFSTLAVDTIVLGERTSLAAAGTNILLNNVLSIAAALAGLWLARILLSRL